MPGSVTAHTAKWRGADDEGLPLFRLPVCHPEYPAWCGRPSPTTISGRLSGRSARRRLHTASEQIVDMLAGRIGMDPEFRYITVAREGYLHHVRPYREYPMRAMMDMLRPHYRKAVEKARGKARRSTGAAWALRGGVSRLRCRIARKSIRAE
ncbi:MAG: hypothetical protein ACLT2T_09110 [Bilophila wadsworthia]